MVSEQVVALLVQDNLDIACQAVEKAAMDRAAMEVDESFATAYEARRRHREVSSKLSDEQSYDTYHLIDSARPAILGPCSSTVSFRWSSS